jgi:hypothetical protein
LIVGTLIGSVTTIEDDGDDLLLFFHGKMALGVEIDDEFEEEEDFIAGFVSCENQFISHVGELFDILSLGCFFCLCDCFCCCEAFVAVLIIILGKIKYLKKGKRDEIETKV